MPDDLKRQVEDVLAKLGEESNNWSCLSNLSRDLFLTFMVHPDAEVSRIASFVSLGLMTLYAKLQEHKE